MAVHFIHVSKAGGTAIRYALREARRAAGGELITPWGPMLSHSHPFRLRDVPDGDKAIFALRDPASRFVSGFYSRLRQGQPRYLQEWTEVERRAFEWFRTPQALADALAEPEGELRSRAEVAMRSIRHLKRPQIWWTGNPAYLRNHLDTVLYIARQETLDEDWRRLKSVLDLPEGLRLPDDDVAAHRTTQIVDRSIGDRGTEALRAWYAKDYKVLEIGEKIRESQSEQARARLELLGSFARVSRVRGSRSGKH